MTSKYCPLFDEHLGHLETGFCDVTTTICPYFGDKKDCGIYNTIKKHAQLKKEIEIVRMRVKVNPQQLEERL